MSMNLYNRAQTRYLACLLHAVLNVLYTADPEMLSSDPPSLPALPTQHVLNPRESYETEELPHELIQARSRLVARQSVQPTGSLCASPPKQTSQPACQQQRRAADSPISQGGVAQGPHANHYRDKQSSPLPERTSSENRRGGPPKGKNVSLK